MVDLGGYVIILVETHDKKVKLYGKKAFIDIIHKKIDSLTAQMFQFTLKPSCNFYNLKQLG